jgi:transcriptional regulator with XRE-family HTH domain
MGCADTSHIFYAILSTVFILSLERSMKTLAEYMRYLGWSMNDLARNAHINERTAARALHGETIRPRVAQRIAGALSEALDIKIMPGDIQGLEIEGF